MPDMKTIRFPGSNTVFETVDAAARTRISTLETTIGSLVDNTLSEAGKAADAQAVSVALEGVNQSAQEAASAAASCLSEMKRIMEQIMPSRLAVGTSLYTEGSIEAPLAGMKVYGKSVREDGTPSASTPLSITSIGASGSVSVIVGGRNLLPTASLANALGSGITWTINEDGSVTVDGRAEGNCTLDIPIDTLVPGLSYSASGIDSDSDKCHGYLLIENGGYTMIGDLRNTVRTWTQDDAYTKVAIYRIQLDSGFVANGVTFYPMILFSDDPYTRYEAYSAGKAVIPMPFSYGLPGVPIDHTFNDLTWYDEITGQLWLSDEIDFVREVYIKRCGVIESYNGETINGRYLSSTGSLDAGAYVVYTLDNAVEIPLTSAQKSAYASLRSRAGRTRVYTTDPLQPTMMVEIPVTLASYLETM